MEPLTCEYARRVQAADIDSLVSLAKLSIANGQEEGNNLFLDAIITNDLLYDTIFSFCSPANFLRFSLSCRAVHFAVKSYMRRAFNLDRLLSRFFDEPLAFRQIQARTGALISGSFALQFFDRSYYPDSDLDIYVSYGNRNAVAEFFFSSGYYFVPERDQAADFYMASSDRVMRLGVADYDFRGALAVFTFEKQDPRDAKKVVKAQMIVTVKSPMESILAFHSTCVMNVISFEKAYSLFPKATFEKRSSLVCDAPEGERKDAALKKYQKRGWRIIRLAERTELCEDFHSGSPGARWMGDRFCWIIPLNRGSINQFIPVLPGSVPLTCDPVVACSWKFVYTAATGGDMDFWLISHPNLACDYVSATTETHDLFHTTVASRGVGRSKMNGQKAHFDAHYISTCFLHFQFLRRIQRLATDMDTITAT